LIVGCIGTLLALPGVPSCGRVRPDPDTWRARWVSLRELVPDPLAFEEGDREAACNTLLVRARRAQPRLLPTSDEALDAPIRAWLAKAESLGYECPAARGRAEAHRAALEDLRILRAEIEAGLAAKTGT